MTHHIRPLLLGIIAAMLAMNVAHAQIDTDRTPQAFSPLANDAESWRCNGR